MSTAALVALILAGLILAGVAIFLLVFRWVSWRSRQRWLQSRALFHQRREWLEARFLTLATQSGKPRGLSWANCEFDNGVVFARDRQTGQMRALVAVTISFEAIEGGGMEDVEAVGNLRAATVVFRLEGNQWQTEGRPFFNVSPAETIKRYDHQLELVE